jgi:hypothetical protein
VLRLATETPQAKAWETRPRQHRVAQHAAFRAHRNASSSVKPRNENNFKYSFKIAWEYRQARHTGWN